MSAGPSPLYFAERLTEHFGGAKIYLKREELNHTGSHKINNCLGQILLARRMGKTRIIAETGAGQHGVATATVCARFGLPCVVYMGAVDVERQAPNVLRMNLLGAEVRPVTSGSATLKDAMNEALRDWVTNVDDTYYMIGSAAGPHPYPAMVRDFQRGDRRRGARADAGSRGPAAGRRWWPASAAAPTPSASSIRSWTTRACGCSASRRPGDGHGHRPARRGDQRRAAGRAARQPHLSAAGRRRPDHSRPTRSPPASTIPASAPSTPGCTTSAAATYLTATDDEALEAFQLLRPAGGHHAGAGIRPRPGPAAGEIAGEVGKDGVVVLNLSGRGDKDLATVAAELGWRSGQPLDRRP